MATVDERTKRAIGVYRELARANDAVNEVIGRQLYKSDLGIAQFWILDWLLHEGPTPQAKLAELLVLSKSGISQVLGRLMAKSLVAQWKKDGYTRQKTIHLTPEGRSLIEGLFPKQARLIDAGAHIGVERAGAGDVAEAVPKAERWKCAAVYRGADRRGVNRDSVTSLQKT